MSESDRERRARTATSRVYRPGEYDEAQLEADDAAFWESVPLAERLDFTFALSIQQWRLSGWQGSEHGARLSELLRAFIDHEVRFLIVGAYALAAHGLPRATGDLDVWVEPTPENAERTLRALRGFGAPTAQLSEADLGAPGVVFQVGLPPIRIDILTTISGVSFAEAWPARLAARFDGIAVPTLGKAQLILNKRATGRPQDRIDLETLDRPRRE